MIPFEYYICIIKRKSFTPNIESLKKFTTFTINPLKRFMHTTSNTLKNNHKILVY